MSVYIVVYISRQLLLLPPFSWDALKEWAWAVVSFLSILMVIDIVRSVFITHRSSYQADFDVFKIKYLIPACLLLAGLVHPDLQEGPLYSYCWTSCLYLDVMALMPQVVMMSKGQGKVEAP